MTMTTEEIVKRLRLFAYRKRENGQGFDAKQIEEAANLIERQAKALDTAAKWIIHKDYPEHLILDAIRAARGETDDA